MQTFSSISQETRNSIKHIAPSRVFAALAVLICVAAWAAVASDNLLPLAIPLALLGVLLAIADLPLVLYALFFSLPLSFEVSFSDSFKTDAPSELLTILVLLGGSVYFLFHKEKFSAAKARHLLPALALLHLFWIGQIYFFPQMLYFLSNSSWQKHGIWAYSEYSVISLFKEPLILNRFFGVCGQPCWA
ncbi:MAG: hypothetical protein IPL35_10375 [Sphingobacteriales bacterium]|nr:hypothetical protein [Sphingobacteriales bacterium]